MYGIQLSSQCRRSQTFQGRRPEPHAFAVGELSDSIAGGNNSETKVKRKQIINRGQKLAVS